MAHWLRARNSAAESFGAAFPDKLHFQDHELASEGNGYTILRYPIKQKKGKKGSQASSFSTYLHGTKPERAWAVMLEGKMRASTINIKQGNRGVYAVSEDHWTTALGYAIGAPLGGTELMYQFVYEL